MPHGLGPEGKKLWESIVGQFDLSVEPHKRRILFDACKTADVLKRMDDAARDAPLTVKGSMGQEVINPLIAQSQTARGQLAQLLARLNFAGMEDDV
jgi:hypothetical protein